MGTFVLWLWLHFCVAAVGTWAARRYALTRNLVDHPGERRSHIEATPRGGGIAIVAALTLAAVWLGWKSPAQWPLLLAFAAGLLLVAGIGWWDDHRPLSPWLRLVVHGVAASQFAAVLFCVDGSWVQAGFCFVAILVLVNVWNFMDGINGIAASQAAVAALVFTFWLGGPWSWLAGALFAASCGFLPFNFPKARVFLGDVGSGALGYALAAFWSIAASEPNGAILMLLPLTVFLVDAAFTLSTRMLQGERWWTPHVSHVYQRAARGYGHGLVTVAYLALSVIAILLICFLSNVDVPGTVLVVVSWYLSALALWGWARKHLK